MLEQKLRKLIRLEIKKRLAESYDKMIYFKSGDTVISLRLSGNKYEDYEVIAGYEPDNWGDNFYPSALSMNNLKDLLKRKLHGNWINIDEREADYYKSSDSDDYEEDESDGDIFDKGDGFNHPDDDLDY